MAKSRLMDSYMDNLLEGRRQACRNLVWEELERGTDAESLYFDLLWPAMEHVENLYRTDDIDTAAEHMATRINRLLVDQIQRDLPRRNPNGKRILITCADGAAEELGAEMSADLFEANGWDVYLLGGGVPKDEILTLVGRLTPDIMMVYGMTPQGVPGVRAMIDMIREVGVNSTMNVMVSGGVFNRADDLWKEINADLYAENAKDALSVAEEAKPREPEVRIPGAPKKRRRRRRPPLLVAQESK